MNYLEKFTAYAPELGAACREFGAQDREWLRELETDEASGAAFDVCEAFSVFWWAWHDGGRLYSLGSCFEHEFAFRPAPNLSEETLSENARELHRIICERFGCFESVCVTRNPRTP